MRDPVLRVMGSQLMTREQIISEFHRFAEAKIVPRWPDEVVLDRLDKLVAEGKVKEGYGGFREVSDLPPPGPPEAALKPKDPDPDALF